MMKRIGRNIYVQAPPAPLTGYGLRPLHADTGRRKISISLAWLFFVGFVLSLLGAALPSAQELSGNENYCQRCHESHPGLDIEIDTCLSCHERRPQGQMQLLPWHSSEGALAGLVCGQCHNTEDQEGQSCLTCHARHTDPLGQ